MCPSHEQNQVQESNMKWALITGSSRGLGYILARALADAGYGVVLTGRDPQALSQAATGLGRGCLPCCLDLTGTDAAAELRRQVKAAGISLSVIVNCLGGGVAGDRRNVPPEILNRALRLNLEAGIEINNVFYDDLAVRQGVIAHIGSTASLHFDAPPGYVISKTAINAYVKNAARTFAKDGVCIFAILPGILDYEGSYINTLRHTVPERYNAALTASTYGRFATADELARFLRAIIAFGTPMINGSLIQFDGGKE